MSELEQLELAVASLQQENENLSKRLAVVEEWIGRPRKERKKLSKNEIALARRIGRLRKFFQVTRWIVVGDSIRDIHTEYCAVYHQLAGHSCNKPPSYEQFEEALKALGARWSKKGICTRVPAEALAGQGRIL